MRGMKKMILFMMLLASTLTASAQDVIVKKDGSTILSKVIEIGTAEIKYKKWNNQNGPNYTISKSEVQAINYENGEKEAFSEVETNQKFSQNDYSSQIAESMAANNRLQKEKLLASAKNWSTMGSVMFGAGLFGGIVGGLILFSDNETAYYCFAGGCTVGGALIGLLFTSIAKSKEKAANSIVEVPLIKHDFELGNSRLSAGINMVNDRYFNDKAIGIGLSLNF